MTRTAFVSFRDDGFWAYDVAGSIFLWHLIDSAGQRLQSNPEPWLQNMVQHWRVAALVTELAHYADDDWSPSQVDTVIELSRNATDTIRRHGDFAADDVQSWPVLDDHRISTRGHDPIPAESVARLGDPFVTLLQGKLPPPPHNELWLYSLDDHVNTIEVRNP